MLRLRMNDDERFLICVDLKRASTSFQDMSNLGKGMEGSKTRRPGGLFCYRTLAVLYFANIGSQMQAYATAISGTLERFKERGRAEQFILYLLVSHKEGSGHFVTSSTQQSAYY
ncbi:hypothetical protein WN943_025383 [Citrus x changshan-huyou]